jgi:hypothetical protein
MASWALSELREGWIPNQAVLGEDAHFPQFADDLVALSGADEESVQALRRHLLGDLLSVAPLLRLGHHLRVEVAGEDLHARPHPIELLAQQDRQRVRLLARGTAGNPDANRRGPVLHHSGQDLSGQNPKGFGIAEELGHADQEILEQDRCLRGIAFQLLHVVRNRSWVLKLDAPPDASQQGPFLVAAEVVPGVAMQVRADFAKLGGKLASDRVILRSDA